jgi:uncharacterized membrane-anchored protein
VNQRHQKASLLAAIVVQVAVLIGMLAHAATPLWVGEEIRVKTLPVDPRSLFRGNYARLGYEFSRIEGTALIGAHRPRVGEIVYVTLTRNADGLHEYAGISDQPPTTGLFLRGRNTSSSSPWRIRFGIEAFFAPTDRALALEKDLRDGGIAVLMVTDEGRVALKDVIGE